MSKKSSSSPSKLPKGYEDVVVLITKRLKGRQYAIRGTASLVLQEFSMNVADIDIICDKKTGLSCNELLKKFLVHKVKCSETDKFRSYFGKFNVNGVNVEVMGEWRIRVKERESKRVKDEWSQVYNASPEQVTNIKVEDVEIPVTTIETELSMFANMGRWNAFHKIKRQMKEKDQQKLI